MQLKKFLATIFTFFVLPGLMWANDPQYELWYSRPAKKWEETLAIGNGRLGAMIYGNIQEEIIQLNENSMYSVKHSENSDAIEEITNLETSFVPANFWDAMQSKQVRPTDQVLLTSLIFAQIEENYYQFSKTKENKLQSDCFALPLGSSIPAVIHFIWLGSDLPNEAQFSIDSWRKNHSAWKIKIWKDSDIEDFQWYSEISKKNFYNAESYAEKADIFRLEILYQFGGIYSDTDVICLRSFQDLIDSDLHFFAGIEVNCVSRITKNPLHVGTAIIGAAKESVTIKYCLDHQIGLEESPNEHILNRTGPGLCSRAIVESLLETKEKILLLPVSYFYPFPFERRSLSFDVAMAHKAPETMAIHLWSGSWLSKEELERIRQKAILQGWIPSENSDFSEANNTPEAKITSPFN